MSKLIKAIHKEDIKMFSEKLTKNLNNKKNLYIEDTENELRKVLFTENLIIEEPVIVHSDDKFDENVNYFYIDINKEEEQLDEFKRVVKINSKGKKRIKKLCGKGFKLVDGKCVKQNGNDKATMRKAQKKRVKTLKSSASTVKKGNRLRKKALKQRKARGL